MSLAKDMYIDIFRDGVMGVMFGLFAWLFTLLLVGLLGYGIFYVADSSFLPTKKGTGTVVGIHLEPAHTTTTYHQVAGVSVPTTTHHPESYSITIKIKDKTDGFGISRSYYNVVKRGDRLQCDYVVGRMSGEFYINEIYVK